MGGNVVPSVTGAEHIGPQQTGDNIEAKRVAGYVWNGSEWQRMTQPGESVPYDTLVDDAGAGVTYVGEAAAGSAPGATVWRIQKIDESANPVEVRFADGVATFTKEWDERASYSY